MNDTTTLGDGCTNLSVQQQYVSSNILRIDIECVFGGESSTEGLILTICCQPSRNMFLVPVAIRVTEVTFSDVCHTVTTCVRDSRQGRVHREVCGENVTFLIFVVTVKAEHVIAHSVS